MHDDAENAEVLLDACVDDILAERGWEERLEGHDSAHVVAPLARIGQAIAELARHGPGPRPGAQHRVRQIVMERLRRTRWKQWGGPWHRETTSGAAHDPAWVTGGH